MCPKCSNLRSESRLIQSGHRNTDTQLTTDFCTVPPGLFCLSVHFLSFPNKNKTLTSLAEPTVVRKTPTVKKRIFRFWAKARFYQLLFVLYGYIVHCHSSLGITSSLIQKIFIFILGCWKQTCNEKLMLPFAPNFTFTLVHPDSLLSG